MSSFNFNAAVPAADAAANSLSSDVIGNKSDTTAGDSVVAHLKRIEEGGHDVSCVPTGADGTTVTGAAGAWADGAWIQIDDGTGMPANAFKILGVQIDTPSAAMIGEIAIGYGAAASENECLRLPFEVATDAGGYFVTPGTPSGSIAGSTRIAARLATSAGGAQTAGIKVVYQEL